MSGYGEWSREGYPKWNVSQPSIKRAQSRYNLSSRARSESKLTIKCKSAGDREVARFARSARGEAPSA